MNKNHQNKFNKLHHRYIKKNFFFCLKCENFDKIASCLFESVNEIA